MTDGFPLLVGVTGKRVFSDDVTENDRIGKSVTQRLRATFAWLDKKFPETPKVLLSGGALGTDLLAADAALERGPTWSVMLVLPYARDLFEKDFPADSPDLARFNALVAQADGPHVMIKELPTLLTAARRVSTRAELDRGEPTHDKALRHGHYEQVGQFIAETAMVLIAVIDPETRPEVDGANGATARVVAFRRAGTPDRAGADIRASSRLLDRSANPLLLPPAGHVWLIDPRERDTHPGLPVRVLPPLTDRPVEQVYAGRPGHDMPQRAAHQDFIDRAWIRMADWIQDHSDKIRCVPKDGMRGDARRHLGASLRLPFAFHRFRGLRIRISENGKQTTEQSTKMTDPLAELARLRRPIGSVQQTIKNRAIVCLAVVAALFVLAVGTLECFAKLTPHQHWMMALYVGCLTGIGAVVVYVWHRRWQVLSEDYRSVSEMLRVQRSWWAAGLPDRVDHVHLQGADRELSGSRDAARAILNWVWLRSAWPTARPLAKNWPEVRDHSWEGINGRRPTARLAGARSGHGPRDWIGGQISYYASNHGRREHQVKRCDSLTWLLFIGAGLLAAILTLLLHNDALRAWLFTQTSGTCRSLVIVGGLLLAVTGLLIRQSLPHRAGLLRPLETWIFAALFAVCMTFALAALASPDAATDLHRSGSSAHGHDSKSMLKNLTIVTFVSLTALAGAIRFVTEKLGLEAEALAYREALGKFERAELLLAANWDPATKAPIDQPAAQALVRELGEQALRENETWLRAHRERPLSPVIG